MATGLCICPTKPVPNYCRATDIFVPQSLIKSMATDFFIPQSLFETMAIDLLIPQSMFTLWPQVSMSHKACSELWPQISMPHKTCSLFKTMATDLCIFPTKPVQKLWPQIYVYGPQSLFKAMATIILSHKACSKLWPQDSMPHKACSKLWPEISLPHKACSKLWPEISLPHTKPVQSYGLLDKYRLFPPPPIIFMV